MLVYPEDLSGEASSNLVTEVLHVSPISNRDTAWLSPKYSPFYKNNFTIDITAIDGTVSRLVEHVDYELAAASPAVYKALSSTVYSAVVLLDTTINGAVSVTYQTLGGPYASDLSSTYTDVGDAIINPMTTPWGAVTDVPAVFPPDTHALDFTDVIDAAAMLNKIAGIPSRIAFLTGWYAVLKEMLSHIPNTSKPHEETAAQVGIDMATDDDIAAFVVNHDDATIAGKFLTLKQILTIIDTDPLLGGTPPVTTKVDTPVITLVKSQYRSAAKAAFNVFLTSSAPTGLIGTDTVKSTQWKITGTGFSHTTSVQDPPVYRLDKYDIPVTAGDLTITVTYTTTNGAVATGTYAAISSAIQSVKSVVDERVTLSVYVSGGPSDTTTLDHTPFIQNSVVVKDSEGDTVPIGTGLYSFGNTSTEGSTEMAVLLTVKPLLACTTTAKAYIDVSYDYY